MSLPLYNRPEILAPAGNAEMMHAAVENGADAVYFGVQAFNARLRADNFTLEELPETMSYLHSRGVKGYLTTNTLIFNEELEQAVELIKACSNAGVDAILVQDLGLAYLANKIAPELPVHASTQMTLTSAESILGAEKLGLKFERVVTARELSKKELTKFLQESTKGIEVFVHGALCVAYSGQCLTSEALGGRSANRGECAQACRLPYDLIVDGEKKDLGDISYLLSPKDLAAYNDIAELIKIGIVSLKIEGRLKTPEYVAATVQTYRHVVDTFFNSPENKFVLEKNYLRKLENSFSRGFTGGYIEDVNHQKVVEGRFPTKRGSFLGEVIEIRDQSVVARISGPVTVGDGVVFDSGSPDSDIGGKIFYLVEKGRNIKSFNPDVEKTKEKVLELEFNLNNYKFSKIKAGNKIWKTKDPHIEAELQESYQGENIRFKRGLKFEVLAETNKTLQVNAIDLENNISVEVMDDVILEKSLKHPLTVKTLEEQLGRLGDSPFYLEELNAEIIGEPMAPLSRLNTLRRKVVEDLLEKRREIGRGRRINNISLTDIRSEDICNGEVASVAMLPRNDNSPIPSTNFNNKFSTSSSHELATSSSHKFPTSSPQELPTSSSHEISVLCRTLAQVEAAVSLNIKRIYTDFEDIRHLPLARKLINTADSLFYPATLRIIKPQEAAGVRKLFNAEPDGILVRNLASWQVITKEKPALKLVADFSLNIANDISAKLLLDNGFELLTPSYDLNFDQLLSMLLLSNPKDFELTAHQYMPMFHMEHCVFCRFLSSGTDSSNCGRPCEKHSVSIEDRKGYQHPIKVDSNCRNTVFNGVAQSAAEYLNGLRSVGINKFRLDFLEETGEELIKTYNLYQDTLNNKIKAEELWKTLKANSKLGVTKGSMDEERVSNVDQLHQIRTRKPAHSKTNYF